jgi:hypothetical protein
MVVALAEVAKHPLTDQDGAAGVLLRLTASVRQKAKADERHAKAERRREHVAVERNANRNKVRAATTRTPKQVSVNVAATGLRDNFQFHFRLPPVYVRFWNSR